MKAALAIFLASESSRDTPGRWQDGHEVSCFCITYGIVAEDSARGCLSESQLMIKSQGIWQSDGGRWSFTKAKFCTPFVLHFQLHPAGEYVTTGIQFRNYIECSFRWAGSFRASIWCFEVEPRNGNTTNHPIRPLTFSDSASGTDRGEAYLSELPTAPEVTNVPF